MQTLIIGAGGHGQVVADILWQMSRSGEAIRPLGFLDDDESLWGQTRQHLPILGAGSNLSDLAYDALIVAVGNNRTRTAVYEQLAAAGERFAIARHPTAVIADDVAIGPGTMICANVVVNPGAIIGANVILNTACTIDHHTEIGDHVHIGPGTHVGGDVHVGDGTLVGIGATIMPQRRIGRLCFIGAAALVLHDVPAGSTLVGVPGRVIST